MNDFSFYLLKSSICIALFYGIYFYFLRKETFFLLNRFYLISTSLLSLIIPAYNFLNFIIKTTKISHFKPALINYFNFKSIPINITQFNQINSIVFHDFLMLIYCAGAAIFLIILFYKYFQLFTLIKNSEVKEKGEINFIYTSEKCSPFSIFNYFIFNELDLNNIDKNKIIAHETAHIRQLHSIDLIIMEFLIIFQWFNPFIWLMKKAIKENHEYYADKKVLGQGINSVNYQLALVKNTVGEKMFALANSFNRSLLKKRINMMNKDKSKNSAKLKVLIAFPFILILILIFSYSQIRKISKQSENKMSENNAGEQVLTKNKHFVDLNSSTEIIRNSNASEKRTEEAIMSVIRKKQGRLTYLYEKHLKKNSDLFGKLSVEFTIAANGLVSQASIIKSTINHPQFENDIVTCVKRLKFESITSGSETVVFPFVFNMAK